VLHEHCAAIGRDPNEILVSSHLRLPPDGDPGSVVDQAQALGAAGLQLGVVYLPPPHTPAVLDKVASALAPLTTG